MTDRLLFEDADVIVLTNIRHDAGPVVVTFNPRNYREFDKGWGEDFFAKRGIDGIFVVSRSNHWFQTPAMAGICRRILEAAGPGRPIVTYGASMGAHAALLFSQALGAKRVLAMSPQFGIRGLAETPWPKSWYVDTEGRTNIYTLSQGLSRDATVYVAYDPMLPFDVQHIRKIEALRPVSAIRVPFAGHNVAGALLKAGILGEVVLGVAGGTADLHQLRAVVRRGRHHSIATLLAADELLVRDGRHPRARQSLRRAAVKRARQIIETGSSSHDLRAAVEVMLAEIVAHQAEGDADAATALATFLLEKHPAAHFGHTGAKIIDALSGDWAGALLNAKRALRAAKKDVHRRLDLVLLSLKNGLIEEADLAAAAATAVFEAAPRTHVQDVYVTALSRLDSSPPVSALAATIRSKRIKMVPASRSARAFVLAISDTEEDRYGRPRPDPKPESDPRSHTSLGAARRDRSASKD